jgi:hypothetical protein
MPPATPTLIPDCLTIAKAFERASSYAVTEESVFAMLGPVLDTTRIQTQGFIDQTDILNEIASAERKNAVVAPTNLNSNLSKMANPKDGDEGVFATINQSFSEPLGDDIAKLIDENVGGGVFSSDCIPCLDRLNFSGQVEVEAGISLFLDYWEEWLQTQYNNLKNMISMFDISNQFIDICALLKFLSDFICVPDLARMLAALMALMERIGFEINGVYDLIFQLIGPLLQPFLSNFTAMVERYILMIIAPLECIVEAMQNLLRKLDYNILFQNIENIENKKFSFGRKTGEKSGVAGPAQIQGVNFSTPTGRSQNKALPFVGFMDVDLHEGPRSTEVNVNITGPVGTKIKAQNAKENRAVEKAADELRLINQAANQVDGANPEEMARYTTKRKAAQEKYQSAKRDRDFSEVGKLSQNIGETVHSMKSSIMTLVDFLRKAAAAVQGFFQDLFDELKKIMGELLPNHGGFIQLLFEKLALVQMVTWISSIIDAFESGINCDGATEDIKVENFIPPGNGFKIWTDENGQLHIDEGEGQISNAIDNIVGVLGSTGNGLGATDGNGISSASLSASQKLKGMIEFTGNSVLDENIARTAETLTTPKSATFKCPLRNTADQANQVNEWIREVSTTG